VAHRKRDGDRTRALEHATGLGRAVRRGGAASVSASDGDVPATDPGCEPENEIAQCVVVTIDRQPQWPPLCNGSTVDKKRRSR
jgi:hypothetical protein